MLFIIVVACAIFAVVSGWSLAWSGDRFTERGARCFFGHKPYVIAVDITRRRATRDLSKRAGLRIICGRCRCHIFDDTHCDREKLVWIDTDYDAPSAPVALFDYRGKAEKK